MPRLTTLHSTVWYALAAALLAGCSTDQPSPDPDQLPLADMTVDMTAGEQVSDFAINGDGLTAICPVVGFQPCGGDLSGTWNVVSFCPEDPAAAAALFEHPYDDRQACKDRTKNTVDAVVTQTGTITFAAGEIVMDVTSTYDLTYGFTDACLAVAVPAEPDPKSACLAMEKPGKLSCTYQPDRCVCTGKIVNPGQTETAPYELVSSTQLKMDGMLAGFCRSGSVLILDWEKHPISWRYWILQLP